MTRLTQESLSCVQVHKCFRILEAQNQSCGALDPQQEPSGLRGNLPARPRSIHFTRFPVEVRLNRWTWELRQLT